MSTKTTELESLKKRADKMNISYHPSIGVESLKAKVNAVLNDLPIPDEVEAVAAPVRAGQAVDASKYIATETRQEMRIRLRREANRLVRVIVNNRNPAMKDYKGDVYTVSNSIVGDIRKYVQYDSEDGYHVPYIIYQHLLEKEYQIFIEGKDAKGRPKVTTKNVKELHVILLDPLTEQEMKDLGQRQALNHSIDQ